MEEQLKKTAYFCAIKKLINTQNFKSPIFWIGISLGLIYLWFGGLKFFPSLSPAEDLAIKTIEKLSFHIFTGRLALILLAIWELIIGISFCLGIIKKWNLTLTFIHLLGTFLPFLLLPELCFGEQSFQFTLIGQYIFKNLLFMAVVVFLYFQLRSPNEIKKQSSK